MIPGRATAEGTAGLARRLPKIDPNHWRPALGLTLSSIGMGSYLGPWDEPTDRAYAQALREALRLGVNVVDCAINYRFQRSERALGAGLRESVQAGEIRREEVLVATKAGYLSFDGEPPDDPRAWFEERFVRRGIATFDELVDDSHCMAPAYLRDQIAQSRANFGLETIDVYYVHNPEGQLPEVGEEEFYRRLGEAFGEMEEAARKGWIGAYGAATWNGFRVPPEDPGHLSLERVLDAARRAGGEGHRFRVVQLPFNLAMPEALQAPTQDWKGKRRPFLEAASDAGLAVFTSVPLLQGRLLGRLPEDLRRRLALRTDAQRAIQFVRSTPGIVAPLVGMKSAAHVRENMETAESEPLKL